MKRKTRINPKGRVVKANQESRNMIANIAEEKGLNYCEIGFPGCLQTQFLAPAHRHPRIWYKGIAERLADFKQWIVGCQSCHQKLDDRSQISQLVSDSIFNTIRGEE